MRLFFITGHGRSGTNYMAYLFQHLGYQVGPQQDLQHGQAHNFPPMWPPEKLRSNYKYLIQVVREPRLVVESVFLAKYSIPAQNSRCVTGINAPGKPQDHPPITMEQAIRSLVFWNRAIKKSGPDLIVKVEEAPRKCREWLKSLDLAPEKNGIPPSQNINARDKHGWNLTRQIEWEAVTSEAMKLYESHCIEYDYSKEIASA